RETFTVKLLQQFRRPIVSTSANVSGQKFPAIFDDISEEIKSSVDYIVNYRQDDTNPAQPSSIIKLWPDGRIDIVRK
ncbi:MAG: Sua5/YciO/YrdC/YwlC family protein, partial [Bacteroidales bacterium]|nr:Sua5/YciO/YrdC/YwlC family protein [Bacteroidales bacterium]